MKVAKLARDIISYLTANIRIITFSLGSYVVVVWTLLRHFTDAINFDIIGQQLVAQQWITGYAEFAVLGPTNYLLKIPVYMIFNGLEFLDPRQRLLLVTILFNVITYVLIVLILDKIYKIYHKHIPRELYLLCLWLATIFGAILWLNYPNSRNLEIAGGLALVYLALKYRKVRKTKLLIQIALLGGVVFFADPLQAYMIGLPLAAAFIISAVINRNSNNLKVAAYISGALTIAFAASKLLFTFSTRILPVDYLVLNSPKNNYDPSFILDSLKNTMINTFKVFDGEFFISPYDVNTAREFFNFLILAVIVLAVARFLMKNRSNSKIYTASILVIFTILISYFVYIASGQASADNTARYLVMIPLLVSALLFAGGKGVFREKVHRLWAGRLLVATIGVSAVLLSGGVLINYPSRYSKEEPVNSAINYLEESGYELSLSSREMSMPITYMTDWSKIALPIICNNGEVKESYLFFDKASFSLLNETKADKVPVVIAGSGPNQCTEDQIVEAFGEPIVIERVGSIGRALIYHPESIILQQSGIE